MAPGGFVNKMEALRKRAAVVAPLLLVLLVLAAFWPVTGNGFLRYDDDFYLTDNPVVRKGATVEGLAWALTSFRAANWHPLTWWSHMADVSLFGLRPGAHHLVNLLLHMAAAVLLFTFLLRSTGAAGRSLFVAALFAVHPLHVQSVAWAAERKDVLSTLIWMLVMLAWAGYARRPSPGRYLAALGLFGLGLMAKPMLVTLPVVLLILDGWPLGRFAAGPAPAAAPRAGTPRFPVTRLLAEKVPFLFLAAASAAVTVAAQAAGRAMELGAYHPLPVRAANALVSYLRYLILTAWPAGLAVFYPYRVPAPLTALAAGAVLAIITALALRRVGARPWLAAGWLWYLVTLLPVIGLVQVGFQAMADRYTYVPLTGVFIAVAWGGAEAAEKIRALRRPLVAAAVIAVLLLAVLTRRETGFWKDDATLFGRADAVTRDNWLARGMQANALFRAGRKAEAAPLFRSAATLQPTWVLARIGVGNILLAEGKPGQAMAEYAEAVRLAPDDAMAVYNLGIARVQVGDIAGAEIDFRRAVSLDPRHAGARANLGAALLSRGRPAESIPPLEESLALEPSSAEAWYNLGAALEATGRPEEAVVRYREALRLRPGFAEPRRRLEALGR
jgi:Flp pilus assembly protein TadD